MNRRMAFAAACSSMFLVAGCSKPLTNFTLISTKNTLRAVDDAGDGVRVTGRDCVPVVLVQWGEPSVEEAIEDAIDRAGPGYDALVDGAISHRYEYFFFGQDCWEVEGTAVSRKSAATAAR